MGYTITIDELIKRPIIRYNFNEEWMNKMTDDEINQFYEECRTISINDGVEDKFPDINAACLSKHIDRDILYNLFKNKYYETKKIKRSY